MKHTDQLNDLFTSLIRAKANFGTVTKDKQGQAGQAKFSYATLDSIIDATRTPLAAEGLHVQQHIDCIDGQHVLCTWLCHSSGQWMCSSAPIHGDVNDPKKIGAYITYIARYAMARILGIVTEEDTDCMAFEQKSYKTKPEIKAQYSPPFKPAKHATMNDLELRIAQSSNLPTEHLETFVNAMAQKKNWTPDRVISTALSPDWFPNFSALYAKEVDRLTAITI